MATLAMSTGIQGRRSGERSSSTHAAHRCAGAAVTLSVGHRGATRIQACRERGVAEGDSMMNRTPGTVTASCDGVEVGIRERKVPMEGRRTALMASAATTMGVCAAALPLWLPREAAAGIPDVGEVLPSSDKLSGFVTFVTNKTSTPALRAGTIKVPYSVDLPANKGWKALPVANAVSGNYCQPRCDEPWVEVKFGSEAQGKLQVIAAPSKKLIGTTKLEPTLQDLGDPNTILAAFGEFVTGNIPVEPEEVVSSSVREANGKQYYEYELEGPKQWATGPHSFASVTTSGEVVLLLTVAATDKQWNAAKDQLKAMCTSFAA